MTEITERLAKALEGLMGSGADYRNLPYAPRVEAHEALTAYRTSRSASVGEGPGMSEGHGLFEVFDREHGPGAHLARAYAILDDAIAEHGITKLFGLFSGGHDSLVMLDIVSRYRQFQGAAHIPTTIGIEETHDFVVETCERFGWPLTEWRGPRTYESLVLEYGFPGPGGHIYMYSWLKERAVRKLVRASKSHRLERIGLVTGVRKSESVRRMGHVKPNHRIGCQVWIAPIMDFTDDDKERYIDHNQLPRNPVVAKICKSGECLCGAFAEEDELTDLAVWYPAKAAWIRDLQARAKALGVHDKWGERPPPKVAQNMCQQCQLKLEFAA